MCTFQDTPGHVTCQKYNALTYIVPKLLLIPSRLLDLNNLKPPKQENVGNFHWRLSP